MKIIQIGLKYPFQGVKRIKNNVKQLIKKCVMAPDAGFEPATKRLTAAYSTAELIRNKVEVLN